MLKTLLIASVSVLAVSAACTKTPPPIPGSAGSPTWEEMNHDQQEDYMKAAVLPKMKAMFQEVNKEEFAGMNCATCHGKGAEDDTYELPNAELPKLDPTDGFKKHKEKYPEMTEFMMKKLVPEMAAIIGLEPYNPETNSGLGCFTCHHKEP